MGIEAGGDDGSGAADAEARADASGDGSGGGTVADLCGEGTNLEASDAGSKTPVSGYGTVEFSASTKTEIVALKTTLTVPAMPPASGTLFLWPGLQPLPGGKSYDPIGNGVLQSVLTWGGTCAPTAPNGYSSWWISAQYVNTYGNDTGHTGCLGGDGIDVAVGDALDIGMALNGTVWNQTVVDRRSGHMATFDLDMLGKAQDWAIFTIEQPTQTKPVSDVVFTSTMLTFADSAPTACQPSARGTNDYFAAPRSSTDGTRCCVSRIILRAQGVAATTPDQP